MASHDARRLHSKSGPARTGVAVASLVLLAAACSSKSSAPSAVATSGSTSGSTSAAATSAAVSAAPTSAAPTSAAQASTPATAATSAPATTAAPPSSPSSTLPADVGFKTADQKPGSGITVWVDTTRIPAATAFKKAYPNIKINVVTFDAGANGTGTIQAKMSLFDKAGNGWPDVVFSTQTSDAPWASQKDNGVQPFAATLDAGLIDTSVLSGFTKGALDPCTVSGHVYCLRNDLAPNVLWYNDTLMKQFGYTVPTTWEQYLALGQRVATEHPGYIIGSVGDSFQGPEIYMWASQCQANDITGARSVIVNVKTPECTRAASLMDTLIANKTLSQDSAFSPAFVKKYTGKTLMLPGPAWYGGAIFSSKTGLNVPAGQIGVAAPLTWGSSPVVTGDVGGGTWFISSHSKDLVDARTFAQFVTTAPEYQVALAPGLPAYATAGAAWLAAQEKAKYYVTPLTLLNTAATQVWPGWGAGQFSQEAIWAKTIIPQVAAGKKIADLLGTWGTAIKNQAQAVGYTVSSQ